MNKPFLDYNKNLKQHSRDLRNQSTLAEALLWKYLRAKQMKGFQFNRQKPPGKFIVDFYCKRLKLVIEIDGSSHEGKELYDADRDVGLKKLGLTILHVTDQEAKKDIRGVLMQIEAWIDSNSKSP